MTTFDKINTIAVIIMCIVGFAFFGTSISVFQNLDASCPSKVIKIGWALIQMLGACMIAAGASYFICVLRSGQCYTSENIMKTGTIHFYVFAVLSLLITGISIAMLVEFGKLDDGDKSKCDNTSNTNKTLTIFITVMSTVGLISSVILIAREQKVSPV